MGTGRLRPPQSRCLTWIEANDELLLRLRVLNGRDADLAGDANRAINRCRDALLAISPALERTTGHRLTQPGIRDALTKWPTPTALKTAGQTKICNAINKRSPRLATKLTTQILTAVNTQTVTLPAETAWGEVIADLLDDLEQIQSQRRELATKIEHVYLQHPLGQILNTLCGFGPRTGARTLAEIGDPHRFLNGARLAAYAGLAPVNRRSGKSINRVSQHRGGNHRLKNAMFIAAFVASQHDPTAKTYYQRKRTEGKHHNAAVICVARRRCDLILAMLKTQTPYNPQHPNTRNRYKKIETPPRLPALEWCCGRSGLTPGDFRARGRLAGHDSCNQLPLPHHDRRRLSHLAGQRPLSTLGQARFRSYRYAAHPLRLWHWVQWRGFSPHRFQTDSVEGR